MINNSQLVIKINLISQKKLLTLLKITNILEHKMIRLIAIILILLGCSKITAQQDPLLSHVFFNKVYLNPAFAGQQGEICANVINRQQWVGLEGAPQTTIFSINSPIRFLGYNSGIGLQISDDRLGFEKNFNGAFQYAHTLNLRSGILSIGLQLGLYNKAFEATWQTPDGGNGQNDIAIPQEKDQSMTFDMGLGLLYTINNFYAGISASHLTQQKFKFAASEIPYLKRHYYILSGYKITVPSSPFEFSPNLIIKYDGSSPQITLNINALYNKKIWGGVTYRTIDALDINVGLELFNGIKIGYAYGLNFSRLIKTNGGSHEVMIGYCFNLEIGKVPQKYRSVRFL
jgi:type IX secretion system PorP/SprF family membrane protein